MQLHVTYIFFTSSLRTVLAFLTQPRRQNYVHGRRATEGTLTLQMRATMARSLHGSAKGRLVAISLISQYPRRLCSKRGLPAPSAETGQPISIQKQFEDEAAAQALLN